MKWHHLSGLSPETARSHVRPSSRDSGPAEDRRILPRRSVVSSGGRDSLSQGLVASTGPFTTVDERNLAPKNHWASLSLPFRAPKFDRASLSQWFSEAADRWESLSLPFLGPKFHRERLSLPFFATKSRRETLALPFLTTKFRRARLSQRFLGPKYRWERLAACFLGAKDRRERLAQ